MAGDRDTFKEELLLVRSIFDPEGYIKKTTYEVMKRILDEKKVLSIMDLICDHHMSGGRFNVSRMQIPNTTSRDAEINHHPRDKDQDRCEDCQGSAAIIDELVAAISGYLCLRRLS
eukprot:5584779-Amphidinium_carterae.4